MIELIALLLIFVFSYFLILKRFEYSLYVLVVLSVLLHKELFSFYRWDLLPIRAFMFALFCVAVTRLFIYIKAKKPIKDLLFFVKDPAVLLLTLLWVVRGLSIIFSKNLQASVLLYAFYTTAVLLFGFIYFILKDKPEDLLRYIKFFIYVVFGLTLFGYFQLYLYQKTGVIIGAFWNVPGKIARVGATFWDVNHYGALLAAVAPVLSVLVLTEKGIKLKALRIIMLLSILATLFLTNSRSAWILEAVALIVFSTTVLFKKFGSKGILAVLVALIMITAPLVYEYNIKTSALRAKVNDFLQYRLDSFDSHFLLLTGSVEVFNKYPILGGGYGSFFEQFSATEIAPTFFGRDPAALSNRVPAHTIWGELIAETGIIGLSIFILFSVVVISSLLFSALKSKTTKSSFLAASMLSVYIGWLSAGVFYSYNSEFFWIIIALYFSYGISVLNNEYSYKDIFSYFLKSSKVYLVPLVVISAYLIFNNLGTNHLIPWDEAIYAKVSKNMVMTGNYMVQNWLPGKVWYEKPPLAMWFMAGTMKVLGFNSLGARLPSALCGIALVVLVYFFGKRLFNKTAGFIAAFALLTTVHFLYYARSSMLDVMTTFFLTLSVYIYYINIKDQKVSKWFLSGLFMGLAVMTKGVVGLIPLPIIFLNELYLGLSKEKKITSRTFMSYLVYIFSGLLIFLPWHFLMYKDFGFSFLKNYIGYHVFDRAFTDMEDKGQPFFWYLTVMKVSMRLWFIALLGAFPFTIFVAIKKRNSKLVFLLLWALFIFIFFSVSKSKLVWYIIPIYPAVTLMVGNFLERILNLLTTKVKFLNNVVSKALFVFVGIVSVLLYLYLNKALVYTSDLTGPQADLLLLKDKTFGASQKVYVDRIELPLVLFYTDGPFEIIDFNPTKPERTPNVKYAETLVLLTKSGRFSQTVVGQTYTPVVVRQEGDWILWYFNSKYKSDTDTLKNLNDQITSVQNQLIAGTSTDPNLRSTYYDLVAKQKALQTKIQLATSKMSKSN